VINNHGLAHLFDEVVLSGDLGIVKPNPEIYNHALEKLHVAASEAIFVDERKVNVDAAETCGIRSLIFSNAETFIKAIIYLTLPKSKRGHLTPFLGDGVWAIFLTAFWKLDLILTRFSAELVLAWSCLMCSASSSSCVLVGLSSVIIAS
jgi:hypothetical protein